MMTNILNKTNDVSFGALVVNVVEFITSGIKKSLLLMTGFALVVMLQVTCFSSEAIASPIAGFFGKQVDKVTEGVKTDMAIDKAANATKEISRDLRDGRTDKVIDKIADTTKEFAKDADKRAKELAKNVKAGTKDNIDKAKDMAKDAKNNVKDLPDQANDKADEAIDSVKNFLGQ